jgi:hypothetical protein
MMARHWIKVSAQEDGAFTARTLERLETAWRWFRHIRPVTCPTQGTELWHKNLFHAAV